MAKWLKLPSTYTFSTSPNLRHCTTLLNTDVSNYSLYYLFVRNICYTVMFIPMYIIFLNIINILIYISMVKTSRNLFLSGRFKPCMAETRHPWFVEIWWSSTKNKNAQFFWDTVYITVQWQCGAHLPHQHCKLRVCIHQVCDTYPDKQLTSQNSASAPSGL